MKCPICKKPVPDEKPADPKAAWPFCCDRCKLIDLGRWLGGAYQIPVDEDTNAMPPDDHDLPS